jgi:hypothetical protein
MSTCEANPNTGKLLERQGCACGHNVDSHTHPSKMIRDPITREVAEHFTHGRCAVAGCACSNYERANATYESRTVTQRSWRRRLFLAVGVWLGMTSRSAEDKSNAKPKGLRVLFLGNSQIFYNDLPRTLETLAASAPADRPRIKASQVTPAGASLETLWNKGTDKGSARAKIAEEQWDYVILQERFDAEAGSFIKHAVLFQELIEKQGAKTVLFCTASISSLYPQGFQELHDMHAALGKQLHLPVAAAGKTWLTYWGNDTTPEQRLALYDPDKAHPGKKGSYIYACSLYAVLTGHSPVCLTHRIPKRAGKAITPAEALKFQEAGWKMHQEMNGETTAAHP